jgi:hypothetical protein
MSDTPTSSGHGDPDDPYRDPTAPRWTEPAAPYPSQDAPTQGPATPSYPAQGDPAQGYRTPGPPPPPAYPTQEQVRQQYGQAPYGQQPGYGQPPAGYGYPPPGVVAYAQPRTNGSALGLVITSALSILFCSNILSIPAVVFGGVALSRQSTDPESSRKLSRWGWIAFGVAMAIEVVAIIGFVVWVTTSSSGYSSTYDYGT